LHLQLAHQVINLGLIVTSALMIWKSLMVVTNSESPVVVVLSGSMEPAFQRGDILFRAFLGTFVSDVSIFASMSFAFWRFQHTRTDALGIAITFGLLFTQFG
jgi:hypothetical protein